MRISLPIFYRPMAVLKRNIRVWRKLFIPSLIGNFGEPLFYLLALGFGLGRFVNEMAGLPYIVFLASGIICSSAMNTATFEGLYSAYTRMHVQQTWIGMMTTPLSVGDVLFGEVMWMGLKSLFSAGAIMCVAFALGLLHGWQTLITLPIIIIAGATFGSMALVMTSVAKSYDFFMFYFTLVVTPMMLLSGVFFPMDGLPQALQTLVTFFPLYHVVVIIRPLLTGDTVSHFAGHLIVIIVYGLAAFFVAKRMVSKRLFS